VYTIGCPRVGNRVFARYAEDLVPATWHLINDQDVVTKWGKLLGLYKRNGNRVIVSSSGKFIVQPSFFEFILHQVRRSVRIRSMCGASADGYRMESYQHACPTWGSRDVERCALRHSSSVDI
jgi:hypothetical protein